MNMTLKIQTRLVYGKKLHYPQCTTSHLLAAIGRKSRGTQTHTFTDWDLEILKELGFAFEQIPQFS